MSRTNCERHPLRSPVAVLVACALLLPLGCLAQNAGGAQLLGSYIGQNVSAVEIAGQPNLSFDKVSQFIAVKPGRPLDREDVNSSIAALKQKAGFSNVGLDLQPEADGVRLLFVLKPAIYFGIYQFPGATKDFSYTRLLQIANYPVQTAYSADDVHSAEQSLTKYFQQGGYFTAQVHSETVIDAQHNLANVLFNTQLGRRAKFGEIKLEGASAKETELLNRKLRSIMARLRAASLKPGRNYSRYRLQNATQYMQSILASQKYVAGQVKLVAAEYDPSTNRADITFHVTTGPQVTVKAEGAHVWKSTMKSMVPIYNANSVDTDLIDEGGRNLQLYFQNKGYFDAQVATKIEQTPTGEAITYDITKGRRNKVSEIAIRGNHQFSAKQLDPSLQVSKARLLSHGDYSEKLVRQSVKNLEDTYKAAGYSHVQVASDVKRDQKGDVQIAFQITEGPRDVVQSLTVQGNTLPESTIAPKGMKLGAGKPYSQALVAEDRNNILAEYLRLGYLTAAFVSSATPEKGDPTHLDVVYKISEGPQLTVANIVTLGRQHTKQPLIDRQVPLTVGGPLREDSMMKGESELYNLNVFDWAQIDPKRPIDLQEGDTPDNAGQRGPTQQHDDVLVKVHESKRNSIVYGFGFEVINRGGSVPNGTVLVPGIPPVGLPNNFKTSQQTFWGPRGTFEYTRKNVRGRAEFYTISAYAARLDQRLNAAYTDPYFRGTTWRGSALFSIEHNAENPIFTARLGNLGYQLQKPLNAKKTSNFFVRYNFQLTRISNLLIPDLVPPDQLNVRLSTLSASYLHDTRDNILDAHRGWYDSAEIDVNPTWLGSNFGFARFLGQIAHYKNIGSGIIWANSVRLGLEQAFSGSVVPLSQEFFSGGGSTLRGFPLNGAGPQRTIPACGNPNDPSTCVKITVPEGGNQLFILNSELRFPLDVIKKNLGIVTFYDGGNVFPTVGFHDFTSLYTNSVGIGLRYSTPVGPIRFDVGHNLNPVPGLSSTQYFVTIGQAF